jgi:hypothetical protein
MMREDLPMQGGGGEEVCEYGGRPIGRVFTAVSAPYLPKSFLVFKSTDKLPNV